MTTPNTAPNPSPGPGPHTTTALVLAELARVHNLTGTIHALITTRQAGVGFLTVEAAHAMDDMIRTEKTDRYRHGVDGIKVAGNTPAPGSIAAFSLLAEWRQLLVDTENDTVKRGGLTGLRVAAPDLDDSDTARVVRVSGLVATTTHQPLLDRTHRDLVDLATRMSRCIDGNQLMAAPVRCPWCGRDTLVIDLGDGTATCGKDRKTGRLETCLCTHSWCPCTTTGTRHVWHRSKGHQADGWQTLASLTRDQREDQR